VCRRVRLVVRDGGIVALGSGSKAARIGWPKELKGVTGDPWAPIDEADAKVLSITGAGFSYRRMVDYLDPELYKQPPLAIPSADDAERGLTISASALARGQGKTEGFHQRHIPVPKEVSPLFARGGIDEFAKLARARVGRVGDFTRTVLRPALFLAYQGGPEKIDFGKPTTGPQVEPWIRAFDAKVDRIFFERVFDALAAVERGDSGAQEREHRGWEREVLDIARAVLERGIEAAPRRAMVRHRAAARARVYFDSNWKKILTDAVKEETDELRTPRSG
jgi:CRISPR system Cascade subunit CasA